MKKTTGLISLFFIFFSFSSMGWNQVCYSPVEMAALYSKPEKQSPKVEARSLRKSARALEDKIDKLTDKMEDYSDKLSESLDASKLNTGDVDDVVDQIKNYMELKDDEWPCETISLSKGLIYNYPRVFELFKEALLPQSYADTSLIAPNVSNREVNTDNFSNKKNSGKLIAPPIGEREINTDLFSNKKIPPKPIAPTKEGCSKKPGYSWDHASGTCVDKRNSNSKNSGKLIAPPIGDGEINTDLFSNKKNSGKLIAPPIGDGEINTDLFSNKKNSGKLIAPPIRDGEINTDLFGNKDASRTPSSKDKKCYVTGQVTGKSYNYATVKSGEDCPPKHVECVNSKGEVYALASDQNACERLLRKDNKPPIVQNLDPVNPPEVKVDDLPFIPTTPKEFTTPAPKTSLPSVNAQKCTNKGGQWRKETRDCCEGEEAWKNPKYFKNNGKVDANSFCKDYALKSRDCKKAIDRLAKLLDQINKYEKQKEDVSDRAEDLEYDSIVSTGDTEAGGLCFDCLERVRAYGAPTTGQILGNVLNLVGGIGLSAFGLREARKAQKSANDLRVWQGHEAQNNFGYSLSGLGMGFPFISKGLYGLSQSQPNTQYTCGSGVNYGGYGGYGGANQGYNRYGY